MPKTYFNLSDPTPLPIKMSNIFNCEMNAALGFFGKSKQVVTDVMEAQGLNNLVQLNMLMTRKLNLCAML